MHTIVRVFAHKSFFIYQTCYPKLGDIAPTILFRHYHGPIGQTNDGQLMVYPNTFLTLECLYIRRFGSPRWNVTQKSE